MRIVSPEIAARRASGALLTHVIIRATARHRDTGATEVIGLWTGGIDREIVVGGAALMCYGAGDVLGMDPITSRAGLEVRSHTLTVSALSPAIVTALRVYDPRLCRIDIYEWDCDPVSERGVSDPVRISRCTVMEAPISQAEEGGQSTAQIIMASASWALTRSLSLKRSAAALRLRAATDKFRDYIDIGKAVSCAWGEKRSDEGQGNTPSPPPVNPFGSRS